MQSPHSDVVWLEPHRYCWVPVATKVTSSDASPQGDDATNVAVARHGIPTWTGAIYGTVPEAKIIGAAAYLLHTPPSACTVHVVDASIIGAHLRRAQEALYRGIKGSGQSGQSARTELDSGGAAAAATPSWGAAPLGGEAELALGGGPARGAGLCRGPCNGPACPSRPAKGARHSLGAGG